MNKAAILIALGTAAVLAVSPAPQLPDPGDTGVSKEQQVQLGTQTANEVYKQMPVRPDSSPETQYVQQLGRKLASVIPTQFSWPYQFHVIAQKEINAFALPGGPVFINIGTITAADNEAELAGVMAHEMSHVYMQHSIKQMKKQQLEQGVAGILGAILGQGGGVAGTLGRLGVGLGAGILSLRYSRSDEAQADSVGAILMYKVGYDPVSLAQFFQKLEQQGGSSGPNFLSDHPNPGNRVASIQQEIRDWPRKSQQFDNQAFVRVKQHAQGIQAYTAQQIAQGAKDGTWALQNQRGGATPPSPATSPANLPEASYSGVKPSGGYTQTQNDLLSMVYPSNWKIYPGENSQSLTIAPPQGIAQGAISYGVVINAVTDQNGSGLDQITQDIVANLQQSNSGLSINNSAQHFMVNGIEGRAMDLIGRSPIQQNGQPVRERDWLITVPQTQGGVVYLVFIAPESAFEELRPTFRHMLQSVHLR